MEILRKTDRRYYMVVMLIILIIPVVQPLGIPITVSDYTKEAYNYVEKLPPGSMVVVIPSVDVALWPEEETYARTLFWHLARRPLKWAVVHFGADAPLLSKTAVDYVNIEKNFPDKKYGRDYVFLGYMAGGEAGYVAFCRNVHAQFETDYFGTSIKQLPIMQELRDSSDIDCLVFITGGDAPMPIRVFVTTFKLPMIAAPTIGWMPTFIPYYKAGQIIGLVAGVRGGAEYELLTGRPGSGLAITDALSLSFLYTILLIVLGNIDYYITKGEKGR